MDTNNDDVRRKSTQAESVGLGVKDTVNDNKIAEKANQAADNSDPKSPG